VRQKNFRLRQLAVAAIGAVTAVSGIAVLGATPAGAIVVPVPPVVSALTLAPSGAVAASVVAGASNQAATNWTFTIGNQFAMADKLVIDVGPHGTTSCQSATNYVGFAAAPTVTVTPITGQDTPPAFAAALATDTPANGGTDGAPCTGIFDQLQLIVDNSANLVQASQTAWTVTVSGNSYNVGSATPVGSIGASGNYAQGILGGLLTNPVAVASNATVTSVVVSADNPPVLVQPNPSPGAGSNTAISPIVLAETSAGAVPLGFVCVKFNGAGGPPGPNDFVNSGGVPAGTASVLASSGATLGSSGALTPVGPDANGSTGFAFQVTKASTTATSYAVSGLSIVNPSALGTKSVSVFASAAAACTTPTLSYSPSTVVFSVFNTNRVYGQTADGTAAAELASQYPPNGENCPATRNVVLATDQNFPDALSASYLAAKLGTGVLLTPTNALAADTVTALRVEGITHVYIVGGPIAVSETVVAALLSIQAYNCGGTVGLTTSTGAPQNLAVTQVYGQTQYDTAQTVAQYFGATGVGTGSFGGGYPTSTTGTSAYNTTSGLSGTTAPASSVATPVAILATGHTFPDAMSVSAMSYAQKWPILLTQQAALSTQASAAIVDLGIKQVIVMGGPIAISDAVVLQVEALGVSVLRIAGADLTDTAQLLAEFELSSTVNGSSQATGLGWAVSHGYGVNVARGDFYADALAGSVVGGRTKTPIVLTLNPSTLGTGIPALFNAEHALAVPNQVDAVTVLGGPLAVTPATLNAVLASIPS
jgi:putative cell wall-binding protein